MNKNTIKILTLGVLALSVIGCTVKRTSKTESNSQNEEASSSSGYVYSNDESTSVPSSSSVINSSSISSSSSTPSSSKSSSSTSTGPTWADDVKALMNKHCGEVLPYVEFGKNFYAGENTDDNGEPYLVMYDEASTLTIENYYQTLESAGWTVETEDGSPILIDEYGDEF